MIKAMQYLGFGVNSEAIEVWLGDDFQTHIPSINRIYFMAGDRYAEVSAGVGDWILKDDRSDGFEVVRREVYEWARSHTNPLEIR